MTGFLSALSLLPVHKLQKTDEEKTKSRDDEEPVTSQQPTQELSSDVIITER